MRGARGPVKQYGSVGACEVQDSFVLGEEGDDGRRAKAECIEDDDSECSR